MVSYFSLYCYYDLNWPSKQNLCTSDVPYSLTDFPRSDLHVSFPFSSKLFDLKSGGSQLHKNQGHILDLHCQLS